MFREIVLYKIYRSYVALSLGFIYGNDMHVDYIYVS